MDRRSVKKRIIHFPLIIVNTLVTSLRLSLYLFTIFVVLGVSHAKTRDVGEMATPSTPGRDVGRFGCDRGRGADKANPEESEGSGRLGPADSYTQRHPRGPFLMG